MGMDKKHEKILNNWDKAMLENQIPIMSRNIEQLIKLMVDGILNQEYKELQDLFQLGGKRIEAWGNQLNIDGNEEYWKVFSYASLWISKKMSERLYNEFQKEIAMQKKYEEVKQLKDSKYIEQVLCSLEKRGDVKKEILAKELSLPVQKLSELLERTEQYKFWNRRNVGNYIYFSITSEGKQYLHVASHKQYQAENNINHIVLFLIDCIVEESCKPYPSTDHIIHKFNTKYGNTQAVFGNEIDKLIIRKSVRKIRNNNRRREWAMDYFLEEGDDLMNGLDKRYSALKKYDDYLWEQKGGCQNAFVGE